MARPPAPSALPARFLCLELPSTRAQSLSDVRNRLTAARKRILQRIADTRPAAPELEASPEAAFDAFARDEIPDLSETGPDKLERSRNNYDERQRLNERAERFWTRHQAALAPLADFKPEERETIRRAAREGRALGVSDRDLMEERIAALHAIYPWLAPASTEIMRHMRDRTRSGAAPFHAPPMILVGPPGIAKSSWARDLARLFEVPAIDIDIGATNGATFAISGTERGWGSATPGRLVTTMLRERVANPLVILDEIDKIPETIATARGSSLPGAFEVLKGMIEPATARRWTCPYYQLPFDLTGVGWIMTTNSIDRMPQAFLDRCKVIKLGDPTPEQLAAAGRRLIAERIPEEHRDTAEHLLVGTLEGLRRTHVRVSLRRVGRMIEKLREGLDRPWLV